MRLLFVIMNLLFLSSLCFSQQITGLNVIGEIPDADDPNLYQIQAGAFIDAQNARNAFERLNRASLNPAFEEYGFFTRVVINGIKAGDIPFYLGRIKDTGFSEVLIRFDPAYEPIIYPPAATAPEAAVPGTGAASPDNKTGDGDTPVEQRVETANATNIVILVAPTVLPVETQTESGDPTEETYEIFNEKTIAIGLGPEINMNSGANTGVGNVAIGAVVTVDISFFSFWAAGLTGKLSHDMSSAWVVEGGLFIRRYFPGVPPRQKERHSGFFAQAEGGFHLIAQDHAFMNEGERLFRAMAGLRIGYRFLLGPLRFFYVEPFARAGFPFAGGIGLMGGIRF